MNHRLPDSGGAQDWSGWLVLQPRRHVQRLSDLDPLERREMAALVARIEQRMMERLGVERLYLLSLGTRPTDHVHFHLVPVSGDPLPGLAALSTAPLDLSREEFLAQLDLSGLPRFRPLVDDEPAGVSRLVERTTQAARRVSPYQWLFLPLFNRYGSKRLERSIVAEIYTVGWLLLLAIAVFSAWMANSRALTLVLAVVATVRIVDILATQGGIILFESQGRGFVGVRSVARTVLLGLINLAEMVVALAIVATLVEQWSRGDAFAPRLENAGQAVLWATGPLGSSAASPLSAGAVALALAAVAILGFLVILVVGVFVSNLSARLEGE